jgi:hypothetical protein
MRAESLGGLSLLIVALASAVAQQPGPALVVVVDAADQRPIPNAEVVELSSTTHRFTNDKGEVRIEWPGSGPLRLRVRQLGFRPIERTVGAAEDTIRIALIRFAYQLPAVVSNAGRPCDPARDSLSASRTALALEQLRLGAEQYESFRRTYPFRLRLQRQTIQIGADTTRTSLTNIERTDSRTWGDNYEPGQIVRSDRRGHFSVAIFFVSTLADQDFWDRHCFSVVGFEGQPGRRALRLAFFPADSGHGAEWDGSALIDSATSILIRVEFRLAGLRPNEVPQRFEGYTTFASPSPFIAIPDSTVAMWWRRPPPDTSNWGLPEVVQLLRVMELNWLGRKPPARAAGSRNP